MVAGRPVRGGHADDGAEGVCEVLGDLAAPAAARDARQQGAARGARVEAPVARVAQSQRRQGRRRHVGAERVHAGEGSIEPAHDGVAGGIVPVGGQPRGVACPARERRRLDARRHRVQSRVELPALDRGPERHPRDGVECGAEEVRGVVRQKLTFT